MLAKVIAWAPTREAAIDRLNHGLEETDVRGVVTNIPFLSALVTHPDGARQRHRYRLHRARAEEPDGGGRAAAGDLELCAAVAAILADEKPQQAATRTRRGEPSAGCRSAGGSGRLRFVTAREPSTR